jgi:hypothetical protein
MSHMKKFILILTLVLLVAACTPAAEPESENVAIVPPTIAPEPTDSPQKVDAMPPTAVPMPPTAVSTNEPPAQPTNQPTDIPTEEPAAETAVIAGRTEEGAFFLGAVDAPVTLIDYSDFL